MTLAFAHSFAPPCARATCGIFSAAWREGAEEGPNRFPYFLQSLLLGLGSHETGERNEGHPLDCVAVVSGSEHRDGERKAKGRKKEGV